jgi:uracil-DNA glycosylase
MVRNGGCWLAVSCYSLLIMSSPSLGGEQARQLALEQLQLEIRACRACEQGGYLASARPIREGGRVSDRVMVVGQAPGALSDAARHHFVGPAGKLLERWFVLAGFSAEYFRQAVYLTAVTRCFPGKSVSGNGDRAPSPSERALCRPFLERELELVRPRLLVPVGTLAIGALLGKEARLEQVVGQLYEIDGRQVLPLPHPSPVSRWLNDPANQERVERALTLLARCREELSLD